MWIDDQIIERCREDIVVSSWVPSDNVVVLGSSNNEEKECFVHQCQTDDIKILKRYGGGGTVLLHPGSVILSLGIWVKHYYQNASYFDKINQVLIKTLGHKWERLSQLSQAGISDIVFDTSKVVGTSMFRSRNYLLYQASILVDSKVDLIEKYLDHPSKEPDYRKKKKHRDFLIGLKEVVPEICEDEVVSCLKKEFKNHLIADLETDLISSIDQQVDHLLTRKIKKSVSAV